MELNNQNYHSQEMSMKYMGASQFKDFLKCEKYALARIKREIEPKSSDALLFGSYVDAWFSGELDEFVKANPSMFNSKTGAMLVKYDGVNKVIDSIKNDNLLNKMLGGEHQVIMTGNIAGVDFKIKIDSYHPGKYIVDGKVLKDLNPIWAEVSEDGFVRNVRINPIKYWGYDIQGAIYQEVVRQNTGKKLPFVLAIATKEDIPSKALLKIDQEDLDEALDLVKSLAPRYAAIKRGETVPNECGKCDVCRKDKKVTGIFSWHTLDVVKKEEGEEE